MSFPGSLTVKILTSIQIYRNLHVDLCWEDRGNQQPCPGIGDLRHHSVEAVHGVVDLFLIVSKVIAAFVAADGIARLPQGADLAADVPPVQAKEPLQILTVDRAALSRVVFSLICFDRRFLYCSVGSASGHGAALLLRYFFAGLGSEKP